ncbi:MAG: acyltransferase domain-containing protein, partial [Acidithiobacillus sp.]
AAGDDTGAVLGRGLEAPATQGPVFVYSGNGCQWAGMGRALLAHPVFADTLAEIDACFVPLAGYALWDELAGVLGADRYALTEFAQSALFALQVGMTALLRSDGIIPVAVTGHSVGEVAAAWACGSLNLADAVRVIYERSRLQGLSRGQGGMTAVASDADTVAVWLQEAGLTETVSIAAWNSPRGSTLVGPTDNLEALEGRLRKQGVGYKRLAIDYPFHSQHMDFLQPELLATLAAIRPAPASVPFISAVTGEAIAGESLDADYWWQNIRAPVRFQQAATSALMLGNIFVELGGHPVLRGYLQDTLNAREQEGRVIPTLRRDEQAPQAVAQAASALWLAGCPLPKATYFSQVPEWVDLPNYPWERERHWQEATAESAGTLSGFSVHPLLGHPLPQHPGEWEQTLDTRRMPFLADHRVGDGVVFAGAAYAEMFLAAARQHFPESAAWVLEDLEILAPLLLEDDVSKVLRLTLQAHGEAQIQARTLLDTQWTLHAKAHIRPAEAADLAVAEADYADYTDATLPRRAADFTASQHYALTDAVGLHYGPVFRTVQHGWRTAEGVQAQLRLPAEAESSEFLLHPALLDGALQLFADWLAEKGASHQGWGFVPVRIERLTRFAEATGTLTATVRVLRQSPQSLLAELRLFNAQGQIVAGCEGVRLRRVRLRRSEAERLRFLENVLVPLPDALPDVQHTACNLPPEVLQSLLPDSLLEIPAVARYVHECAPLLESLQQAYADESAGSGDASIPASAIWHTLLRDYPEFFPLILQVGRQGLAATETTPGQPPVDLCATAQHTLLHTITPVLSTEFAALVLQLRNHLPDNRLLRCAEVSAGGAEALPALTAHLHPDLRCRLWHLQPTISEPSESQGWITQTLDATPVSGLDALWLRLDHPDRNQQWSMLEAAERALAENGILWIQGVEPEAWWVGNHSAESTPLDQQSCRHWLLQRGFTETSAPPAPSVLPGPYLLSLQKGATQRSAPAPRRARDAGPWLLLGTAASTDHPDWSMLQTALHSAGYVSQVCRSDSAQGLLTYLTESATTEWAGILYVDLPSGQIQDHAATVLQQCVLLTALGKWAVRRDALPPLYLLTRGGIRATHAGLYPQNHPEDGLDAAALCGFARSLQNEWPELR